MTFTRKHILGLMATAIAALGLAACNEDEGLTPVSLDGATLTADQAPGMVVLRWDIPDNADYRYIRVEYNHPEEGPCMRTASIYSDSIAIDGLLQAYGDIQYTLTTVSEDGTPGTSPCQIAATAGRAERTVIVTGSAAIDMSTVTGYTDNQESSEGPLANLFDGNTGSYFHMSWSNPSAWPHYIVVDLGKEVEGVTYTYTCRNHGNCDNPGEIEAYGSNSFTDGNYDETSYGAELLGTASDLSGAQFASGTSAQYIANEPFRYLWLKILSSTNGSNWVALSELTVTELFTDVDDPEQNYLDSIGGGTTGE